MLQAADQGPRGALQRDEGAEPGAGQAQQEHHSAQGRRSEEGGHPLQQ